MKKNLLIITSIVVAISSCRKEEVAQPAQSSCKKEEITQPVQTTQTMQTMQNDKFPHLTKLPFLAADNNGSRYVVEESKTKKKKKSPSPTLPKWKGITKGIARGKILSLGEAKQPTSTLPTGRSNWKGLHSPAGEVLGTKTKKITNIDTKAKSQLLGAKQSKVQIK